MYVHITSQLEQSNMYLIGCIVFSLVLFTSPISGQKASRALILPVSKDPSTQQYTTTIFQRTPLRAVKVAIDVGGKALWVACDKEEYHSSTYRPALCRSHLCSLANSNSCGDCWDGPRPGCNNNTCSNVVYNTVSKSAQIGELATDVLALQSIHGPMLRARDFPFTCGSLFLGEELAKGAKGIAGFGRSDTSLPSLLSNSFNISNNFAMCLSSSKGVALLGEGPAVLSARLAYTPLLVNPVATARPIIDGFPDGSRPSTEHFIGVESVRVGGRDVRVSPKLLSINRKGGGGAKISTVTPYTVLHTSIYKAVAKAFAKAMVAAPARIPFGACYKAAGVPAVEFRLGGNVSWSVSGVKVMGDVACLAFLDGGKKAATSIVIGGHQLEDHFLEFDVRKSRFGFTSTSCATFNFTNKP